MPKGVSKVSTVWPLTWTNGQQMVEGGRLQRPEPRVCNDPLLRQFLFAAGRDGGSVGDFGHRQPVIIHQARDNVALGRRGAGVGQFGFDVDRGRRGDAVRAGSGRSAVTKVPHGAT